jgi:hypothetical protein
MRTQIPPRRRLSTLRKFCLAARPVVGSGSAQSLPCANGLGDVLRPDRGGFSGREAKLGQRPIPAEVAIKLNEFLRRFIADVECARRDRPSGVGRPWPVVQKPGPPLASPWVNA